MAQPDLTTISSTPLDAAARSPSTATPAYHDAAVKKYISPTLLTFDARPTQQTQGDTPCYSVKIRRNPEGSPLDVYYGTSFNLLRDIVNFSQITVPSKRGDLKSFSNTANNIEISNNFSATVHNKIAALVAEMVDMVIQCKQPQTAGTTFGMCLCGTDDEIAAFNTIFTNKKITDEDVINEMYTAICEMESLNIVMFICQPNVAPWRLTVRQIFFDMKCIAHPSSMPLDQRTFIPGNAPLAKHKKQARSSPPTARRHAAQAAPITTNQQATRQTAPITTNQQANQTVQTTPIIKAGAPLDSDASSDSSVASAASPPPELDTANSASSSTANLASSTNNPTTNSAANLVHTPQSYELVVLKYLLDTPFMRETKVKMGLVHNTIFDIIYCNNHEFSHQLTRAQNPKAYYICIIQTNCAETDDAIKTIAAIPYSKLGYTREQVDKILEAENVLNTKLRSIRVDAFLVQDDHFISQASITIPNI